MDEPRFLRYCIGYFGIDKQMVVCMEEMAELTQQLSKFVIEHKAKDRAKVLEEVVDVQIMLDQMKIIFDISELEIETGKNYKYQRLEKYIDSLKDMKSKL